MIEKVIITDSDVIASVRNKLPEATEEKKGLKSHKEVRHEKRTETIVSLIVYETDTSMSISTSILISLAAYGGGPMTLYYMTINRPKDTRTSPRLILNRIGGSNSPARVRFKLLNNDTTGAFKIFLERQEYTPSIYAKILNTISPSSERLSFAKADESEVDGATYIEET